MDDNEKIEIISRQTDMSDEEIKKELEKNDGNIERVIKNYICPGKEKKREPIKSKNQLKYKLIRKMMDEASKEYEKKKR